MKKIIVSIAACCALSLGAFAQDTTFNKGEGDYGTGQDTSQGDQKYCAMLKDGKISVTTGDNNLPVNNEVALSNGVRIKRDGTVLKGDGTKTKMKDGDCVDGEGNFIQGKTNKSPNDKPNKDKDKNKDEDPLEYDEPMKKE